MTNPLNAQAVTALQNVSKVVDVTDVIATVTGGVFFQLLIIAIFIIMLISLIRYGFEVAISTSSFLCLILSLYLVFLGYINMTFVLGFGTVLLFSILYMYITKQ